MKRSPIRRVSKRRAKELTIYRVESKKYLTENLWCRVKGCKRRSQVVHHRAGREGRFLLLKRYWMPCCRVHHDIIESFRAWGYAKGYLLPRTSNPDPAYHD